MKFEIKVEQVLKRLSRYFADRTLADACKNGIEQLAREICSDTSGSILEKIAVSKGKLRKEKLEIVHPIIRDPARSQTVDESLMSTFKASIIDLKICGTCTFKTYPKELGT